MRSAPVARPIRRAPIATKVTALSLGALLATQAMAPSALSAAEPSRGASASPKISVRDVRVGEAAGSARFELRLSQAAGGPVSVSYATAGGTATQGDDFVGVEGRVTFEKGELKKTVEVPIVNDSAEEGKETFFLDLAKATGAALTRERARGTIIDDDKGKQPKLKVLGDRVVEDETLVYRLVLSKASSKPVTVHYSVEDGTAEALFDYLQPLGTQATFGPGEKSKTIDVPTLTDGEDESDETVLLVIEGVENAEATDTKAIGTIVNRKAAKLPKLDATGGNAVSETGGYVSNTVIFSVVMYPTSDRTVTVKYRTEGKKADPTSCTNCGIATDDVDYPHTEGTLTFAPGERAKEIEITVFDDGRCEFGHGGAKAESFALVLFDATNAIIRTAEADATILDDDPQPPTGPPCEVS